MRWGYFGSKEAAGKCSVQMKCMLIALTNESVQGTINSYMQSGLESLPPQMLHHLTAWELKIWKLSSYATSHSGPYKHGQSKRETVLEIWHSRMNTPETLLSCCIPDLELDKLTDHTDYLRAKFNPDGVIRVIFDWKNMEKTSATEQWRV